MRGFLVTAMAACTMLVGLGQSAEATVIVDLTSSASNSGLGQTTFGTVSYSNIVGGVAVEMNLFGYNLVNTGGPHVGFAFNLSTSSFVLASYDTSLFKAVVSPSNTPFGQFTGGLDLLTKNGQSGSVSSPLRFNVMGTNGVTVTEASFINGPTATVNGVTTGWMFAADVVSLKADSTNGKTGAVGGAGTPTDVPEPATLALLGVGVAGLIGLRLRSHRPRT